MPSSGGPPRKPRLAWGLGDQIDQMRGKVNLKDRDRRAYYEWAENHRKSNEIEIIKLRQENKSKRVDLADRINADSKIIKTVFQNRKEEQLSLQRLTAQEAAEVMDQKTCESAKELNALRNARIERQDRLRESLIMLQRLQEMEKKSPEIREYDQRIRTLENGLDKAKLKFETAKNISDQYETIVRRMREESMTYPADLEMMERTVLDQKRELKDLRKMNKEAKAARDKSKEELGKLEQKVYESKRSRDQLLSAMKKEVEQRKEESDKFYKATNRGGNYADAHQEQKKQQESLQKAERQKEILSYEEAFQKVKEASGLSDIEDFVHRIECQDENRANLQNQSKKLEELKNKLSDENEKLRIQFNEEKFSGETNMSSTERGLENQHAILEEAERKYEELHDDVKRYSKVLVDVKTGVTTLAEKLREVKLKPVSKHRPSGNVLDDAENCKLKLTTLFDEIKNQEIFVDIKTDKELHDFMLQTLPEDNVRIRIEESIASLTDEFEFDKQDVGDVVLTRDDIKKSGQEMVDSKLKPKRKKKKN